MKRSFVVPLALSGLLMCSMASAIVTDKMIEDDAKTPNDVLSWGIGVAVNAQDTALSQAVEQTLNSMRNDGTLHRLFTENSVSWIAP